MAVEDEFERIVEANPDLTVDGPKTVTFRLGDSVASIPQAKLEEINVAVGLELLTPGGDFMKVWVAAVEFPALIQWVIAESAFKIAMVRVFELHPFEASQVLERLKRFIYFAATLKPHELKEAGHGR